MVQYCEIWVAACATTPVVIRVWAEAPGRLADNMAAIADIAAALRSVVREGIWLLLAVTCALSKRSDEKTSHKALYSQRPIGTLGSEIGGSALPLGKLRSLEQELLRRRANETAFHLAD
jgi:hypothetical protein